MVPLWLLLWLLLLGLLLLVLLVLLLLLLLVLLLVLLLLVLLALLLLALLLLWLLLPREHCAGCTISVKLTSDTLSQRRYTLMCSVLSCTSGEPCLTVHTRNSICASLVASLIRSGKYGTQVALTNTSQF